MSSLKKKQTKECTYTGVGKSRSTVVSAWHTGLIFVLALINYCFIFQTKNPVNLFLPTRGFEVFRHNTHSQLHKGKPPQKFIYKLFGLFLHV